MAPEPVQIAMSSRTGGRARTEDACGHWRSGPAATGDGAGPVCCVLADGAGGHGGGDVASQTAVATVLEAFAADPGCDAARIRRLIHLANEAVVAHQRPSDATRDMRSTLVVWACDPGRAEAIWGHSGDSRLYGFRDGRVVAQTRDHSLYQALLDAGIADPSQLPGNPQRNVLIASLGSLDGFDPDVLAHPYRMEPGDAFLICSDGFWDPVADSDLEAALQRADSPQAWIDELEQSIIRQDRAGQDNFSAIAIWFGTPDFRTRIAAA